MSCYEWESGSIKLPTKVFASFRREFIAGYNRAQQNQLDRLTDFYNRALSIGQGKRGFDYHGFMVGLTNDFNVEDQIGRLFTGDRNKPLKPTKKMFNFVTGKDNCFEVGESADAEICFNKDKRMVGWYVSENNHACERAHEYEVSRLFFRMLAKVQWTRGSGGEIVGNNEYNRDDHGAGGGGNYSVMTFGNRK